MLVVFLFVLDNEGELWWYIIYDLIKSLETKTQSYSLP